MSLAESCQRLIAGYGEAVTLRRARTGLADVDVTAKGFVAQGKRAELAGSQAQTEREVRIGNAEIAAAAWPGPPVIGDRLQVGGAWFNVQAVETRKVGTATALHILTIRG